MEQVTLAKTRLVTEAKATVKVDQGHLFHPRGEGQEPDQSHVKGREKKKKIETGKEKETNQN